MSARLLLIGLDGATFSLLDPLMDEGVMPNLKSLLESGARAELSSVIPALTPPAWTSLMTGRSPGNHGIFDFLRFELRSGARQLRVLDADDVSCPTVWSMLAGHGLRTNVLNFPMTFPARGVNGSVVPGWVPWRHLRLACYPRTLFGELQESIPGFKPREMAMDMSLEERALEGCHGPDDYENLIRLHIRREQQWFEVMRHLMAKGPVDLAAILFDGVDKLQHFCWRFLDRASLASSPSPPLAAWEERVRGWCLDYYRTLDGFIGEIVNMAGKGASIFVASDHGFGPTVEVFHLNAWLHKHGYLFWAESASVAQKHPETLGLGTMARRFYEIDWEKTTAYCPTPSSNGIYITPPGANGGGVSPERYNSFRSQLMDGLLQFKDPATGERVITEVWTREEAFSGTNMKLAPDLTLSLRDGGLVSILPSEELLKPRTETNGAHRPNGVFAVCGDGIRQNFRSSALSILDVAPLMLHTLGLPIPKDLEGKIPEGLFEAGYLRANPVRFDAPAEKNLSSGVQIPDSNPEMDEAVMGQLRALGYME